MPATPVPEASSAPESASSPTPAVTDATLDSVLSAIREPAQIPTVSASVPPPMPTTTQ